jgi:hypothetical protein
MHFHAKPTLQISGIKLERKLQAASTSIQFLSLYVFGYISWYQGGEPTLASPPLLFGSAVLSYLCMRYATTAKRNHVLTIAFDSQSHNDQSMLGYKISNRTKWNTFQCQWSTIQNITIAINLVKHTVLALFRASKSSVQIRTMSWTLLFYNLVVSTSVYQPMQ